MPGGNCICGVVAAAVVAVVGRGLVVALGAGVAVEDGVPAAGGVAAVVVGGFGEVGPAAVWVADALTDAST